MPVQQSQTYVFRTQEKFVRRLPDPNGEQYLTYEFRIRAKDLPEGLPYDPNARPDPNLKKQVPKKIAESLLSGDGIFHMKNQGIKIIAHKVEKGKNGLIVHLPVEEQGDEDCGRYGIADGGHTYAVCQKHKAEAPENQWVEVKIETGVPRDLIPEIAGGLNTNQQVQEVSLANLAGEFDPIKLMLEDEPYYNEIAWHEGASGSVDIRDILGFMTCFNIEAYPALVGSGRVGSGQPVEAYESKRKVLIRYRKDPSVYEKLSPIAQDILYLHDFIHSRAADAYGARRSKATFHAVAWSRYHKKPVQLPFSDLETNYTLYGGALYPILAAYRLMVTESEDGDFVWDRPFEEVLDFVGRSLPVLIERTADLGSRASSDRVRGVPDSIGKNRDHWLALIDAVEREMLYARVAAADDLRRERRGELAEV